MLKQRSRTNDKEQKRLAKKTVLDTSEFPDPTRQEFAKEADINYIFKTFGVNAPQRQGVYGNTVDYNLDLQGAHLATAEAMEGYNRLPEKLRQRYKTLDQFLKAVEAGAIQPADLTRQEKEREAAAKAAERQEPHNKEQPQPKSSSNLNDKEVDPTKK